MWQHKIGLEKEKLSETNNLVLADPTHAKLQPPWVLHPFPCKNGF